MINFRDIGPGLPLSIATSFTVEAMQQP